MSSVKDFVVSLMGADPYASNPEYRRQLELKNGFPRQYFQFLANVVLSGLQDAIFPMPMTSYSATDILSASQLRFELIYLNAQHEKWAIAKPLP